MSLSDITGLRILSTSLNKITLSNIDFAKYKKGTNVTLVILERKINY